MPVCRIDSELLAEKRLAYSIEPAEVKNVPTHKNVVSCGRPMPGYEIQIRDSEGNTLPDRHVGTLFVRGPSVMTGYFDDNRATADVLSEDGWLNTGDLAYIADDRIFITGRDTELLTVDGRSIWPQDLELIAEQHPEVRTGDAAAIAVAGDNGENRIVILLQNRNPEKAEASRRQGLR